MIKPGLAYFEPSNLIKEIRDIVLVNTLTMVVLLGLCALAGQTCSAESQYDGVTSGTPEVCDRVDVAYAGPESQVEYTNPPQAPQMVQADERPPVVNNNTINNYFSKPPSTSHGHSHKTARSVTKYVKVKVPGPVQVVEKKVFVPVPAPKPQVIVIAATPPPAKPAEKREPMNPYTAIAIVGIVMASVVGIIAIIVMANKQIEIKKAEHDLKVAEIAEKVADQDMPDIDDGETCFYRTTTTRGGTISKTMKRVKAPTSAVPLAGVGSIPIMITLAQLQQMPAGGQTQPPPVVNGGGGGIDPDNI